MFLNSKTSFEMALGKKKMLDIFGFNLLTYFPLILLFNILILFYDIHKKILKKLGITKLFEKEKLTSAELKLKKKEFKQHFDDILGEISFSKYFQKNKKKHVISFNEPFIIESKIL